MQLFKFVDYSIAILITVIVILFAINVTDYQNRMNTYNYHMCVEVYGLNKECK